MPVDVERLKVLLTRIRHATRANFPLACSDLFRHIDENLSDNPRLLELNAERSAKWGKFPGERPSSWKMPATTEDRQSLAYDLFRTVGEKGEDGRGLLFHMYRKKFDLNVHSFRADFFEHLVDVINAIANAEPRELQQTSGREKQQKFGILDAPNLLASDLEAPAALFGFAVVYFDLDNFKSLNTRFSERVVDAQVLPNVQRLVARAAANIGYAYAEGGDEMVVLLVNSTLTMGAAFADALRVKLEALPLAVDGEEFNITASFGVAASAEGGDLPGAANLAKNYAKTQGKNCVAVSEVGGPNLWKP